MDLIQLVFFILVVVVVVAAVLGVVRAVLALPLFVNLQPYGNLIYALIVLLIVLIVVSMFSSGSLPAFRFRRG